MTIQKLHFSCTSNRAYKIYLRCSDEQHSLETFHDNYPIFSRSNGLSFLRQDHTRNECIFFGGNFYNNATCISVQYNMRFSREKCELFTFCDTQMTLHSFCVNSLLIKVVGDKSILFFFLEDIDS